MKYLTKELGFSDISQILWFNIETAPIHQEITEESPYWSAWSQKVAWDDKITNIEEIAARYTERAALYKEFSSLVSLSYGRVVNGEFKVKRLNTCKESLTCSAIVEQVRTEKELIEEFFSDVEKFVAGGVKFLGGFSALSFSVPFVSFRAMVNDINVIPSMDVANIAPWQVKNIIDVKKLLEGTSQTQLSLLGACAAFGLEEPIEDDLIGNNLAVVDLFCKYIREPQVTVTVVGGQAEVKPLGLMDRIFQAGAVTDELEKELLEKCKEFSAEEKQQTVDLLKGTLGVRKVSAALTKKILK